MNFILENMPFCTNFLTFSHETSMNVCLSQILIEMSTKQTVWIQTTYRKHPIYSFDHQDLEILREEMDVMS